MGNGFFQVVDSSSFITLLQRFKAVGEEMISLDRGPGRVLSRDVVSGENLPLVDRSCMDGYAVRSMDVFGASESSPAYLECGEHLPIDRVSKRVLGPGECVGITTGGTLPPGADSVVMVEHTQDLGAGTVEIRRSAVPGENVMYAGEDVAADSVAVPRGTELRSQDIGLLAAIGVQEVPVATRPRVGIISTGDELVAVTCVPRPGQVRDVNSHTLACLIREGGGEPVSYGLVRDDLASITETLQTALAENDTVFISGGSSVGMRDLTIQALESLPHSEILAHGVSISPGKPTILARVRDKAVFGLPGQVTSGQVVVLVFGIPFLRHLAGAKRPFDVSCRPVRPAVLDANLASKPGREDYVRVRLVPEEDGFRAVPRTGKSGLLRTLVEADGLLRLDADSEGAVAGSLVDIWMI